MDLSGMIFVALAIAWAVYLIPKALQHHDEMARTRGVETFSSRMRVFTHRTTSAPSGEAPVGTPVEPVVETVVDPVVDTVVETDVEAVIEPVAQAVRSELPVRPTSPVRPLSREAARRAAARRRTVLWSLVVVLGIVGAAAGVGYLPMWSVGIPVVLIVAFLVIARMTVRRAQVRRVGAPGSRPTRTVEAARVPAPAAPSVPSDREDTMGLNRAELAEPDAMPLEDEGSLWDPLPVTLPTYVSKPRARRQIRTIELTQSSGHDPVDSALVRNAEVVAPADLVDPEPEVPEVLEGPGERRAAGA